MTPLFSIVIPVYNVAPYLREGLDSLFSQSLKSWEAICIDDGSIDESGKILDEYSRMDSRIRVVHKKNAGVSSARNAGIELARGEWLMFLDPDDCYHSQLLNVLRDGLAQYNQVDMLRFAYGFANDILRKDISVAKFEWLDLSREVPASCLSGNALMCWQNVFRANKFRDVKFRDYICGEDRFYTFECLERCQSVASTESVLYFHRIRPGSYGSSTIRNVRGWTGEIVYRVDIMRLMLQCQKELDFSGVNWLDDFFCRQYVLGLAKFNDVESSKLWRLWEDRIKFVSTFRYFKSPIRLWLSVLCWAKWRWLTRVLVSIYDYGLYLRRDFEPLKPLGRLYRKIRKHGEYA